MAQAAVTNPARMMTPADLRETILTVAPQRFGELIA